MSTSKSLHRLADLIRVGCQYTEKAVKTYWIGDDGEESGYNGIDAGKVTHACALGAAYLGCYGGKTSGQISGNDVTSAISKEVDSGEISWKSVMVNGPAGIVNPVVGSKDYIPMWMIYLNDEAGWTREAIADWIDTVAEEMSDEPGTA